VSWFEAISAGVVGSSGALESRRDANGRVRTVPGGPEEVSQALRERFTPNRIRRLDPYSQAALLAAGLALEGGTGGWFANATDSDAMPQLGLIVCTGLGPVPSTNAFMDSFLDFGPQGASPTAFAQTVHNLAASTISMFLDIQGPMYTVSQPGLGLASALCTARAWLSEGRVRAILMGAVDDASLFSRLLGAGTEHPLPPQAPKAIFSLVVPVSSHRVPSESSIFKVQGVEFSPCEPSLPDARWQGPTDLLAAMIEATARTREMPSSSDTQVMETWGATRAAILFCPGHGGQQS